MNQRIRHLTVALIALFAVLFVQLTTWQYVKRDSLVKDPRNNRITLREFDAPRGEIVTADGKVIAASEKVDTTKDSSRFTLQRTYPYGDLYANITGYYTLGFGSTQIERIENDVLAGKTAAQQLEAGKDLFSKTDTSGTVHLTLDSRIQTIAKKALAGREGSVVVMNPATGGVLGMYSNPSYDSNKVASHNASDVNQFLNN